MVGAGGGDGGGSGGGGVCARGGAFRGGGVVAEGFAYTGDGVDGSHELLGDDVDHVGQIYHGGPVVYLGRLQDEVDLVYVGFG